MGFSVVGPGRFIGSGHPDPSQSSPPNLGLIESRDAGKSFRSVSLLGEADFHTLRSAGSQVYGFDGASGKLMVSADGGRRWVARTPPAGVFDLAISPDDPKRVVVSTEKGLFASTDAGKRWRPERSDTAGLLAWTAASRLVLVDGEGQVSSSSNAAKSFAPVGSMDGGAGWVVRATP